MRIYNFYDFSILLDLVFETYSSAGDRAKALQSILRWKKGSSINLSAETDMKNVLNYVEQHETDIRLLFRALDRLGIEIRFSKGSIIKAMKEYGRRGFEAVVTDQ